jgi:hypothetical protein
MAATTKKVPEKLILFEKWMDTTKWMLEKTARFPKRLRYSLTMRVEDATIAILEGINKAAYRKDRSEELQSVNEGLNRLRVLVRLCNEVHVFSDAEYGEAAVRVDEAGRILGGWMKTEGLS